MSELTGGLLYQVYKQVADITDKVSNGKGSLQSLALAKTVLKKSVTFALCSEILKYKKIIETLIDESKFLKKNSKFKNDKALLNVIVYELLFGRASQSQEGVKDLLERFEKVKHGLFKLVKPYYSGWNSSLVMLKIERKAKSNADLIESSKEDGVKIDRFLRVNTMKTTIDKFVQQMKDENFPLQDAEPCIKRDEHVPELFKLYPSNTPVHNLSCVKDATCIVQDKASCLPVHVMFQELPKILKNDEPIHIIDGCAAPGNKTTYLAAKLSSMFTNSSNTIHAFDRDTKRVKVLSDRVKEANAHKIVNVVHGDFSKVDPNDPTYSQVRAILLDPSCSGSGIVSRDGSVGQESDAVDESRLLNLSKFQATLVNHALQFPSVQCVVYSTCSIHEQENECVVADAIRNNRENFHLVKCFPEWDSRGNDNSETDHVGPFCVRTYPEKHATNGFFVSCFVRNGAELNEPVEKSKQKKEVLVPESKPLAAHLIKILEKKKRKREAELLEANKRSKTLH